MTLSIQSSATRISSLALIAVAAALSPGSVRAQAAETTVQVPTFALPASNQLSPEARRILARQLADPAPDFGNDVAAARAYFGKYNAARLVEMRGLFATREKRTSMGGIRVDVVTPSTGVLARNATRVLINVHGGAFKWGSGSGALIEAIPIAATMGIKVVAVDYRLAPEHRYPAASEDVATVYRELLKTYPAGNIGIYGCSAGGIITAQAITWFANHGLPRPGAAGTFCGTGAPYGGDSPYLSGPTTGGKSLSAATLPDTLPTEYMEGVPATDAQAYPGMSVAALRAFPPTLQLAGGRDFAVSALTRQHRRLAALGVPTELQLFDGLGHAFFVWPQMPESKEAYALIARFFDRYLGGGATPRK